MATQHRSKRHNTRTSGLDKSGVCPSCGQETVFKFNGQQIWPEHIAATMGIPPVVTLWNCENCHSTISENALPE